MQVSYMTLAVSAMLRRELHFHTNRIMAIMLAVLIAILTAILLGFLLPFSVFSLLSPTILVFFQFLYPYVTPTQILIVTMVPIMVEYYP